MRLSLLVYQCTVENDPYPYFLADHLVADDHDLEHIAFVSGSIRSISSLLSGLIPDPNTPWAEDEEPHFKSLLLEV